MLTISATGTADRIVTLSAMSNLASGVNQLIISKILVDGHQVSIIDNEGSKVEVYNIAGVKMSEISRISNHETITLPTKGAYVLRVINGVVSSSIKVMIR